MKIRIKLETALFCLLCFVLHASIAGIFVNHYSDNLAFLAIGYTFLLLGLITLHSDMEDNINRVGIHYKITAIRTVILTLLSWWTASYIPTNFFSWPVLGLFIYGTGVFFLTFDYLRNYMKNNNWDYLGTESWFDIKFAWWEGEHYLIIKILYYILTSIILWLTI